MKKTSLFVILLAILTIAYTGCSKSGDKQPEEDTTPFDPSDAERLQKSIKIESGKLTKGALPSPSSSPDAPKITMNQPSASVTPGGDLIFPFKFTSPNSSYSHAFLQIEGVEDSYFKIENAPQMNKLSLIASGNPNFQRMNALTTGSENIISFSISIPDYVQNGTFTITYAVVDKNGNVSSYGTSTVVLKDAINCSNASASGNEGLTFTQVHLGDKAGIVKIDYNTFSVPDRIDIYQNKVWLDGTGTNPGSLTPPMSDCRNALPGFVGKRGVFEINYDPAKGKTLTIVVSGCLGGGTAWDWSIQCPQ